MSDGTTHQISVELPQAAPQAPSVEPQQQSAPQFQQQPQAPEPQYSEYARGLLDQIPEADRPVVSKYLPQWDASIQRQAAQLEATVAPYLPLAQYGINSQDASLLAQLYDMLDTNPQGALDLVNQIVQRNQQSDPQFQQYQPQQYPQQQSQQQFPQQGQQAPLHPQLQQQMDRMGQMMETVAQTQLRQQQMVTEAAEDKALESYLTWLRQEKGDFDEGYVLSQLEAGVDGAVAVDNFNSMVQQRFAAQSGQGAQQYGAPQAPGMQPPPVLNGGSAAVGNLPLSKASDQQRRQVVAQMLQQANQQGN